MLRETKLKEIPEIKIHGRTTACRDPLTLFWTASGFECNVMGSAAKGQILDSAVSRHES